MFDLFFLRLGRDRRGFDYLFDEFLSGRDVGEGRRRHYEVLRRMLHRYFSYMKYSEKRRRRWRFDLSSVDASFLADFYDYVRNEYVYVKKYPRILEDYPEKREIKPRGKNYMYGVFKQLRAFFNWSRRRGLLRSDPFEGFICPSEPRVLPDGAFRRQQGILPISGNRCRNETRACENSGKMRTIEKKVVILTEFVSMSNR